ncbi:Lpg1974 family pore-forming outer membrane protein [Roseimaritima ulvae]|uniref:Uncharacterized protein n=1 Tax=Roseimaritima ulvae TaxID=980254 RepID=A0A5B9R032_9BACT|nr:Lpg1974 family pore-forming outer membrane protein [Roseimaritima ulvae]QEG43570.1 hypothetical protein UC8_56210 [Roseimaritima ulvae]
MSISLISRLGRGVAAAGLALVGGAIATTGTLSYANDELPPGMAAELDNDAYQRVIAEHLQSSGEVQPTSHQSGYVEGGYVDSGYGTQYAESSRKPRHRRSGKRKSGSLLGGLCSSDGCPDPWWAHRHSVYGEFLYLNAGSSDLVHAIEFTGPTAADSPTGPVGIINNDPEAGFRVGASLAASNCTSLNLGYTYWSGSEADTINAQGTNVLNSQILHPSLLTTGAASLQATAVHDIDFQLVDLNYRHLWKRTQNTAINWTAGVRYGNMEQSLIAQQTIQVATGLTTVTTDIDFDGFGIHGGLDMERYSCETGLFVYGKGMASLMAGEWNANYRQVNQFGGGVVANDYEDFHATPILEGELGMGWMNNGGHIRFQLGYMMSGWYEAVSTRGYVDAVRANDLLDIGETITFSGLTTRLTVMF